MADSSQTVQLNFPLSSFEVKLRTHAHLGFFAYMVVMPLGIFIARYARTFTNSWFWPHAIVNFVITGPMVFATFAMGYQVTTLGGEGHFVDPHQKMGLALLILYIMQVLLGTFIHYVKFPALRQGFPGGRLPQNYLHAILGLTIVLMGAWQAHYGLWIEWGYVTGNGHPVGYQCKQFWTAIVVLFVLFYVAGLALLPRQFRQERAAAARQGGRDRGSKLNDWVQKNWVPLQDNGAL
ncbi:hypothetical protein FB45DRAFT_836929 [Roridomyces roridus]|uniref:Cytochrome b561 domain-containing protein n=1 Tax=Roridomyces roridus TaxID=1738132 RepID=A0AAD7BLW5_9AGAR|nr:hypothetical protein FB45DRAFT_836929 [Roridomyces roridus]